MHVTRSNPLSVFVAALAMAVIASAAPGGSAESPVERHQPDPPMTFAGGEASVDELMDKFIRAVEENDREALAALRLSREEYFEIIVPGKVPSGEPPRRVTPQVTKFFWEMMDYKSDLYVDVLLDRYGGRPLERGTLTFSKPVQEYDWYRAWGEIRQAAREPDGTEHQVRSGWIAEVAGRYKFISYQWDD